MTLAPARGLFVTFEGSEGSGKSTQVRLLRERLARAGYQVLATREPGGTPLGDRLRALVLGRDEVLPTHRTEALVMCAARAQLVETVIRPALEAGAVVLCDRYADSTLAYQGYGRGVDLHQLRAVLSFATAGLWPDLTMLLDVPVEQGLARKRRQDVVTVAGEWTRFESEALQFHERVRAGYQHLAQQDPARWRILDATYPVAALSEAIWRAVHDCLPAMEGTAP